MILFLTIQARQKKKKTELHLRAKTGLSLAGKIIFLFFL